MDNKADRRPEKRAQDKKNSHRFYSRGPNIDYSVKGIHSFCALVHRFVLPRRLPELALREQVRDLKGCPRTNFMLPLQFTADPGDWELVDLRQGRSEPLCRT